MDFVKKYEDELRNLKYPEKAKKPNRSEFATNKDYGSALDEYEYYEGKWRLLLVEYHKMEQEIIDRFKQHLARYFNVTNHPKVEKIYTLAWERGHSNGLYEVALEFETLVDLIK